MEDSSINAMQAVPGSCSAHASMSSMNKRACSMVKDDYKLSTTPSITTRAASTVTPRVPGKKLARPTADRREGRPSEESSPALRLPPLARGGTRSTHTVRNWARPSFRSASRALLCAKGERSPGGGRRRREPTKARGICRLFSHKLGAVRGVVILFWADAVGTDEIPHNHGRNRSSLGCAFSIALRP